MKKITRLILFIVSASLIVCAASENTKIATIAPTTETSPLVISAKSSLEMGWMENGWGKTSISISNTTEQTIKLLMNQSRWTVDPKNESSKLTQSLSPKATITLSPVGYLSSKIIKQSGDQSPRKIGNIIYELNANIYSSAYTAIIPVAVYDEPMVTLSGKYLGVTIRQSLVKDRPASKNMFKWMDDAYTEMMELTGGQPYNGDFIIVLDAPPHPWWAYAGNPIVLSGKHVPSTLDDFCNGFPSFGWTHELGHDFDDGIGGWYNFNGPFCEFQANVKLVYAYLHMPDRDIIKLKHAGNTYPTKDKEAILTVDHWFSVFARYHGDRYLGSTNSWEKMSSDNYLSFYMRYVDVYGWECMKDWYRTYRKLAATDLKKPKTKAGKINLMCAVLNKVTGVNQVPIFQLWRLPVTEEKVAELNKRYTSVLKAE